MPAEPSTRAFLPADYDAVLPLWHASEGVEVAEGDDRATIEAYLARNPGLSRVAELDGQIVAAVLCGHDGRRGLIYHLAVSPAHRGRGLGRLLVQQCLAGLRTARIPRALILVETDNTAGREFWLARGFEEITGATAFGVDLA